MKQDSALNKNNIMEFLRYALIGGVSALVDMGVNYLCLYYIFHATKDDKGPVALSVTIGFIAGLIVNYVLSNIFVFRSQEQKEKGKTLSAFLIYAGVGIVGYFITVGLTLLGTRFIGKEGIWYLLMTAVVKGIVLIWNYLGRKIFVYKGK
ncbi:MAG: GtrA family protein [Lachnospiraceae bacterium]|nr:GtrA family protein [Lachnospiraceae bacterium]